MVSDATRQFQQLAEAATGFRFGKREFVDSGVINFVLRRRTAKAKFVRVPHNVRTAALVTELGRNWGFNEPPAPGCILRITGGPQGLARGMVEGVSDGVVHAAGLCHALTLTNGLDAGVVGAIGSVHERQQYKWDGPLIGVVPWESVQGRHQLLGPTEVRKLSKRVYKESQGDGTATCLEPNHTHFLVVGGPPPPRPASKVDVAAVARLCRKGCADSAGRAAQKLQQAARGVSDGAAADASAASSSQQVRALVDDLERALAAAHTAHRVLLLCGGDEASLLELIAFLRSDDSSVAVVAENLEPGLAGFLDHERNAPARLSDALAKWVRGEVLPEEWAAHRHDFDEVSRLASRGDDAHFRLLVAPCEETSPGEPPELGEVLLEAVVRQERSLEGKLRLQVAWQDAEGIDEILTRALPAWDKERPHLVARVLQQCLEAQYSAGVAVALSHGANPANAAVNLRKLCHMLADPEVSRYPALFPHFVADARDLGDTRAADAEAEAAADADAGADADVASLPVAAADWAEHLWHGCGMGGSQGNAQAKTLLPKPLARARAAPSCRNELGQKLKQSGLLEHHPAHDHYVREVWELLARWVPGLDAYWLQKVEPKAIDLYLWAVLLGNTPLAMGLLPSCSEPLRAGLLGALLCNQMSAALPLDAIELQAAARKHEDFSESLLDACSDFDDARKLLTTRSRHWPKTVIQLAVQAGLKSFCDSRYCQSLCDALYRGVASDAYIDEPATAMLPKWIGGGARGTLLLVLHALLPLPLPSRGFWLVDRRGVAAACRWYDYYKVPLVKQLLRMVLSMLYILLYSSVVVSLPPQPTADDDQLGLGPPVDSVAARWAALQNSAAGRLLRGESGGDGGDDGGGGAGGGEGDGGGLLAAARATALPGPRQGLVLLWTVSICLDEFYKWARLPSTFEVDSWRLYNYVYLATTLAGFALRAAVSDELGHAVLCFNCVVGWLRVMQDLTLARGLGVLVIMIQSMISDIVLWFLVTLLFLGGFMVAFCALAEPQADADEVYATPLWAMLGWFEPGDIDAWAGQRGKVLLWMYVMVSNVLLVNLLIAMMGDTYARIKENADTEWKFARLVSGIEFVERVHAVPPPFSLPIMALNLTSWLGGHRWEADGDGKDDGIDEWAEGGRLWLAKKEKLRIGERALRARRAKEERKTNEELEENHLAGLVNGQMEQLESALKAFATQVNAELTYLREKLVPDEADAHRHHHLRSRRRKNAVASGAASAASSPVTCSMRPATLAVLAATPRTGGHAAAGPAPAAARREAAPAARPRVAAPRPRQPRGGGVEVGACARATAEAELAHVAGGLRAMIAEHSDALYALEPAPHAPSSPPRGVAARARGAETPRSVSYASGVGLPQAVTLPARAPSPPPPPYNGVATASGGAPAHAQTGAARLRRGPTPAFVPLPAQRMSDPYPYSPSTAGRASPHAPAEPSDWRPVGPSGSHRSRRLAEEEQGRSPGRGASTARAVPSDRLYHA